MLWTMKQRLKRFCFAWGLLLPTLALASGQPHGPLSDTNFFPIAVWLQDPGNATRFKAAGINLYVALWLGPTEAQLAALKAADMPVICAQNNVALAHKDDPTILGWMHNDEPDNAQPLSIGIGHGPPVRPETVVQDYQKMRAADPSRPVMLNLGQGAAWDNWKGRGVRRNHPEDYPAYLRGCDIASFDIYPVVHEHPEVSGKLEYVANGVERLAGWTGGTKPVWSCIECTHINNEKAKATPEQVRAEVWMALIHGAKGLVYFVHEFKPKFKEAALLDDPPMLAAVTALNAQIHALAPVLNSSNLTTGVSVKSSTSQVPVAFMAKRNGNALYLFATGMRNGSTHAAFELSGLPPEATAEVLDESRTIPVRNGLLEDEFKPYATHLYRIR
jgi:hypothetical protein